MALCKLSNELLINSYTLIDNAFISDYLPNADNNAVKVYLYGLFQSRNITGNDNSAEGIALALGLEQKEIINCFEYWDDLGLIRFISKNPLSIEYLPLRSGYEKTKKYDPEKYRDLMSQLEKLFIDRNLTSQELLKYVEVIEEYKITPEAMIMIATYCVNLKGNKILTNYILTVAKAWSHEGVRTYEQVESKLKELDAHSENMRMIFYALGLKSTPDWEDKQMFVKWNKSWGYDLESILFAAKLCKKRGGMKKLDSILDNFYKLGLFTLADIKEHSDYIVKLREIAIEVNKTIGVYYDNIDIIVEEYITKWLDKGFDDLSTLAIAKYCFRKGIKTLAGMDAKIEEFYRQGVISIEAITEYIKNSALIDKEIKDIIMITGSSRMVTDSDRAFYNTWTNLWGFETEVIRYAAELSVGKSHSFAYINQMLTVWRENNCKTLDSCKKYSHNITANTPKISVTREYTKETLDSIFDDIDDL